jgi:hypothetical protein
MTYWKNRKLLLLALPCLLYVSSAHAGLYTLEQTFNDPTVTTADLFGISVALDGNNVLIGARRDDTNGQAVGQAHLFGVIPSSAPVPATLWLFSLAVLGLIRLRSVA